MFHLIGAFGNAQETEKVISLKLQETWKSVGNVFRIVKKIMPPKYFLSENVFFLIDNFFNTLIISFKELLAFVSGLGIFDEWTTKLQTLSLNLLTSPWQVF